MNTTRHNTSILLIISHLLKKSNILRQKNAYAKTKIMASGVFSAVEGNIYLTLG